MQHPTGGSPAPEGRPRRFQILALDGGGIRGLYTAKVLAELESDLETKVVDHFDLIAGTSTGGIVALGLAFGLTPAELVQFYVEEGPRVFPRGLVRRLVHWFRCKYDEQHLERCLRERFGDRPLSESRKALVIPAYNLDADKPRVLKTPHHAKFRRDPRIPAWQVAMATAAAPTYLPASAHIGGERHVDGGMWANNPAMVAVVEAHCFLGVPLGAMRVLSIGTARVVKERSSSLDRGGLLAWRKDAVDILFRAQGEGTTNQLQLLLGDRVHRLNPIVPESWSALDVPRPQAFASRASQESKEFAPTFAREFQPHTGLDLAAVRALAESAGKEKKDAPVGSARVT